jgi:UDP-glucose:(glucosyl)LPS alpha-1,2-glucosyltransferase
MHPQRMHGTAPKPAPANMTKPPIVMINAPIHPIPPTKGAAVEWWIYQTCKRLARHEPHVISLAAPNGTTDEQCDGVAFHRVRFGRMYRRLFQKITRLDPLSYVARAARTLRRVAPVIVHVHNAPAVFTALRSRYARPTTTHLLHLHNEMELVGMTPGTQLVAVSEYLRNWYCARYPQADVHVITNGVDTGQYRPRWEQPQAAALLRHELGLPADKKIVLYAGRISAEKGTLELVHAFAELAKRRSDVFLLLIGELRTGNAMDRRVQYGAAVTNACRALAERCRHMDVVSPFDMHRYYALGDLLVMPSQFEEPLGMVALEAMAAGTPVLVAARGGLREIVREGDTGFFIADTRDPDAFARQIDTLLDRADLLARVSGNARRYVEQNHDWQSVARQVETLYARLPAS